MTVGSNLVHGFIPVLAEPTESKNFCSFCTKKNARKNVWTTKVRERFWFSAEFEEFCGYGNTTTHILWKLSLSKGSYSHTYQSITFSSTHKRIQHKTSSPGRIQVSAEFWPHSWQQQQQHFSAGRDLHAHQQTDRSISCPAYKPPIQAATSAARHFRAIVHQHYYTQFTLLLAPDRCVIVQPRSHTHTQKYLWFFSKAAK